MNGIVVSSVDRVDGRLDVADVLAATTLSVGINGLALHMQREEALSDWACPYCDFNKMASPMSQLQVVASQVGLPVARVLELDGSHGRLTDADIALVVAAAKIRPEQAAELIGRRLDDLVQRIYAEATVPVAGQMPVAVSAPYVSWMGGVLIAAELAKAARGLPLLDRRINLDLSGVPLGVASRKPKDTSGQCVCASPWRRRWLDKLYGQK